MEKAVLQNKKYKLEMKFYEDIYRNQKMKLKF